MKRVVLLYGDPGNGKSTLATHLASNGFRVIPVDDVYVAFIQSVHPLAFLPILSSCIAQHYETIFRLTSPANVEGWHQHLLDTIRQESAEHDAVVVEGFLLKDCKDQFDVALTQQSIRVFHVKAESFSYVLEQPRLTAADVTSLVLDG